MASASHAPATPGETAKPDTKLIWRTFWILLAATAVEFIVAFVVVHEHKFLRVSIFLLLTVVKAFYIVGEFMHLAHEKKALIRSIVLPMLFVIWFIVAMLVEGNSILEVR